MKPDDTPTDVTNDITGDTDKITGSPDIPENTDVDDGQIKEGQSLIGALPEDNDTPFSPPDDAIADPPADSDVRQQQGKIEPTNEVTDNATDIDTHQEYDEGLAGAAEASEPNAGNAVVDYNPANDQRKQDQSEDSAL
jgi:hypothetical protein